jgi:hypothetical protein
MNPNDDVVYRRRRLGPLHQRHPGRSRSLVRHHNRLHPAPPDFENLDSIAARPTWAQRIVEQHRAQNFDGGCQLGSLSAELVE